VTKPNWREMLVLSTLSGGEAQRVQVFGASVKTLDELVAKGLIVHVVEKGSRADLYRITPAGLAIVQAEEAGHAGQVLH
jgi:hypothetical protein